MTRGKLIERFKVFKQSGSGECVEANLVFITKEDHLTARLAMHRADDSQTRH